MECYESCIIVCTFAELSCVSLYSDWFTSANFSYLNLVTRLSRLYLYQMESKIPSDSSIRRCVLTLPIVFAAPCTGHFLPSFCLALKWAFVLVWTGQVPSTAMTTSSDLSPSTASSVNQQHKLWEGHQETQRGEQAHTQHPTASGLHTSAIEGTPS